MALFGRRKPSVQVEIVPDPVDEQEEEREREREREREPRRRHRLSKPLTNGKVSVNASTTSLSLQETITKSRNPSTSDLVTSGQLSSHESKPDLRKQIRNEVFDTDRLSPQDALKSSSTLSVAQMIRQFDKSPTTSEGSRSSSPPAGKPKKRRSLLLRRFSAQNSSDLALSAIKENANSKPVEAVVLSPSSSVDRVVDSPAIPPTRRASFTPGVATRKPTGPLFGEQKPKHEPIQEADEKSLVGSDYLDWQPRPPTMIGRAGTPADDLSYSHLTGLRIGSLQVMNGRASPAFSEMSKASKLSKLSKHLLAVPKILRDVSSEYGDADEMTHETVPIEDPIRVGTPNAAKELRTFSWESVVADREDTADLESEIDVRTKIPLDMDVDDDQASMMAKEYMAELPLSPYVLHGSSSVPGSLRRVGSDRSMQKTPSMKSLQMTPSRHSLQRTPSMDSLQKTPSMKSLQQSPSMHSLQKSPSLASLYRIPSTTSLQKSPSMPFLQGSSSMISLRRSPSPESMHARNPSSPVSFRTVSSLSHTGSVVRRPSLRLAVIPDSSFEAAGDDDQPRESVMSWYSPVEPSFPQHEPFQSAVEFQVQKSPTQIQPQPTLDKSDSGYSSSNSLRSLRMAKFAPTTSVPQTLLAPPVVARAPEPELRTMPSQLQYRPSILKSRKTEPAVPTFANLRPTVMSISSTPTVSSIVDASIQPVKQRKKLQKKRRKSQPADKIAITRVRSFEAETIPAIPSDARENLRIRTQEVPELEQTYAKLNAQASSSTMFLPMNEIRFPSPEPEPKARGMSYRPKSISRPRSWISRSKEDNSESRRVSDLSQTDALAIINDLSTAASSVGNSPYAIAYDNFILDPLTGIHKSRSKATRHKSMMDDRMAAAVAKFRRQSLQQREAFAERRPSFNDRGGIPGKTLRPASFIGEAPPITQEMLQIYRSSSMQSQGPGDDTPAPPAPNRTPPPPPPPHSPRPAYDSSPPPEPDHAPPPPPHSPHPAYVRPVYVEYQDSFEGVIAPPPPSHSPRPVDITPDPWVAQAATWRARRESAGEALREQARYFSGAQESMHQLEEPLYPVIPPRNEPVGAGWPQYTASPEAYTPSHQPQYEFYQPSRPEYYLGHSHARVQENFQEDTGSGGRFYQDYCTVNNETDLGRFTSSLGPVQRRPLPNPRTTESNDRSRPHSQAPSLRSQASSLAEELHPEHLDRPQPAPEFGRYSGGMGYGYERGNGFGGSAGTRSVSGKAEATRKGVPLRAGYGVDLGDVPVLQMVRI